MNFIIYLYLCILSYLKNTGSCVTDEYKIYNIESDKVCHQSHGIRRITTGLDGLIVKENNYFDNLSGKYEFTCHFEVETGFTQAPGILVVFQKLNLRQNPNTGECIDYVKIRPVRENIFTQIFSEISTNKIKLKKNKLPWIVFCGDLNAKRDGIESNPNDFKFSKAGYPTDNDEIVEVEIFIAKVPTYNEFLQLEMVFTAYTSCKNSSSDYKECGMNKCIKKKHFKDGVVNCPFMKCPDEGGCDLSMSEDDVAPENLHTKITLTAVTSIFCSFFLFLGCIWCCRYFEMLCWSANNLLGHSNPVELSPISQPSPSAPPTEQTQNKDLPPSYETLFPDRCSKNCEAMC